MDAALLVSIVPFVSKLLSCLGRWKSRGSLWVAPSITVQLPSLVRCAYLFIDSSQLFPSPPTCHRSTVNILIHVTNLFDSRHPSIEYYFSPCASRTGTSCSSRRFLALPFRSFALSASVLPLVGSILVAYNLHANKFSNWLMPNSQHIHSFIDSRNAFQDFSAFVEQASLVVS